MRKLLHSTMFIAIALLAVAFASLTGPATAATLHHPRPAASGTFSPHAAITSRYACQAPFGSVQIPASAWAGSLTNTGHDGATFTVYSNYRAGRSPAACAGNWMSADGTNQWGLQYQCTELAVRAADAEWATGNWTAWRNAGWNGAADAMKAPGQRLGLTWTGNGTGSLPVAGDLMIWSSGGGSDPGHVAVVSAVGSGTVTFVGENQGYGMVTLPVSGSTVENNGWKTGSTILGWLSHPNSPPPPPSISASAQSTTVQGDFNGDGHTDVAVFYDYPDDQTGIWVFWGNGTGGFSNPTLAWESGTNAWDATAIKPVVGDFNGDGKADIAAFYNYGNATTSLFVFYSQGTTFSNPVGVWGSGAGNWDWNAMRAVAGDFNGDGVTDIAVMYAYPNDLTSIDMFLGNGSGGFSGPVGWWSSGTGNWNGNSTKLAAGDVNHDGKADIIAMYNYGNDNTSVFVFYSQGTSFSSPQGQWNSGAGNWSWSQSKLVSGDFNGDGQGDLGVFYGYPHGETALWVFYGNSSGGLSAPVVDWDSGVNQWDWSRVVPFSGDYNGDGRTDIGAFFAYDNDETGQFLFISSGSGFSAPVSTWDSGPGAWNGHDILIA